MKYLTFILFLVCLSAKAQVAYLLPNEEEILSFETKNGKKLMLAKDKDNGYIVYRFGSKEKIEREYPEKKDKESFKKFTYSYALRGGGKINAGIDLNYVAFVSGAYKYVIYTTYFAEDKRIAIGVKIIKPENNEPIADIKGRLKTQSGNLTGFRDSGLIAEDEEGMLYD